MLGCKPLGESIRVRLSKKTAAHYCTNVQLSKKTYVRVQKKSFRLRLSAPAHWITSIEEISLQRGTAKNIRYPRVAPCFPQISRERGPPLHTCCPCFAVEFSRGYPEESGYEQGLTDIRMRWCKEHKYLDKFGPPERNTIRPVWWFVFPQVLSPILEGCLFALI